MREYKTLDRIREMVIANEVFITAIDVDDMKPKRRDAARKAYADIYDIQIEILQTIKLVEISQLLAENEVVVPYIVNEYSRLKTLSVLLTSELKSLNQFNEYKHLIEKINKVNKVSELATMLFDDLTVIAQSKSVDIDFKQEMEKFKKHN